MNMPQNELTYIIHMETGMSPKWQSTSIRKHFRVVSTQWNISSEVHLILFNTVIKHDRHFKHEESVENMSCRRVFSTFFKCPQTSGVFYQCNTQLSLLHLLYDIELIRLHTASIETTKHTD